MQEEIEVIEHKDGSCSILLPERYVRPLLTYAVNKMLEEVCNQYKEKE